MDYNEAWKLIRTDKMATDPFVRLTILSYQLEGLGKATFYRYYYNDPVYRKEQEIAISDLIAQIHLFCLLEGFDFRKLEELGYKRIMETINTRLGERKWKKRFSHL